MVLRSSSNCFHRFLSLVLGHVILTFWAVALVLEAVFRVLCCVSVFGLRSSGVPKSSRRGSSSSKMSLTCETMSGSAELVRGLP
ncbi:hypothetical protein DPMN_005442 [Dreissena polymorpha]|uniref:Uncharacterized protein n=1 Tax=Dreissena polymorpha TaxID=45954 RepID=A0A9D4MTH9_DREPO|nr:hypothetical protein DPMN_005442 [Dreissena polymorpha]